ncbi:hypothetical protein AWJ20_3056 [Sugiyamaella lignohabitans]|uniref:ELYS-like domain-containing protein n=1 Tax=Sugiyamaella lignohabitans TaxID=796027 RepID=A0A167FKW8_9ASCO|nr:uncharacterized protein AWJ20_3056 [Sugiyamaella lignohabitans]ANB15429.1 hypothetical protein AWJ20_3056 [Sugiyamaella lignohabitans]
MTTIPSTFTQALVRSVKKTPYTSQLITKIQKNRKTLGDTLFFDVLIRDVGHVDPTLYPPKDLETLLLLIQKIESQDTPNRVHQAVLIFYLFLDYPLSLTNHESLANYYAEEVGIPTGYRELITGFWYMDQIDFDNALLHLGHPEALPTYHDKIFASFIKTAASNNSSTSTPNSSAQILAYFTAKSPRLVSSETIEHYVDSLLEVSLFSALRFVRSVSPSIQPVLFRRIIMNTLSDPRSEVRKKNIWRLANLPLTDSESVLFKDYLLEISKEHPDTTVSSFAKDVLIVRSLHTGDVHTSKAISELPNPNPASTKPPRVEWNDITRGIKLSN